MFTMFTPPLMHVEILWPCDATEVNNGCMIKFVDVHSQQSTVPKRTEFVNFSERDSINDDSSFCLRILSAIDLQCHVFPFWKAFVKCLSLSPSSGPPFSVNLFPSSLKFMHEVWICHCCYYVTHIPGCLWLMLFRQQSLIVNSCTEVWRAGWRCDEDMRFCDTFSWCDVLRQTVAAAATSHVFSLTTVLILVLDIFVLFSADDAIVWLGTEVYWPSCCEAVHSYVLAAWVIYSLHPWFVTAICSLRCVLKSGDVCSVWFLSSQNVFVSRLCMTFCCIVSTLYIVWKRYPVCAFCFIVLWNLSAAPNERAHNTFSVNRPY